MLVLTRKKGESIIICFPDDQPGEPLQPLATVTLKELRGGKAVLIIQGDKALPIHREEIFTRIQAERKGTHA